HLTSSSQPCEFQKRSQFFMRSQTELVTGLSRRLVEPPALVYPPRRANNFGVASAKLEAQSLLTSLLLAERNRFLRAGQSPRLEQSGEMQHSKEWDHKRRDEHQG